MLILVKPHPFFIILIVSRSEEDLLPGSRSRTCTICLYSQCWIRCVQPPELTRCSRQAAFGKTFLDDDRKDGDGEEAGINHKSSKKSALRK
jgi:hypothetical protein